MKCMENKKDINIAKEILRLRVSQMVINEKYKAGLFKVPIHLALGHEAIAVAVDSVLAEGDKLVCSHRNMHYNLARTKALRPILDEYFLKKTGLAGAELGSMNLANEEKDIIYTSSILGNNLPVATGVALAEKVNGGGGAVIVETGDGAMEEGSFYESLLFMKSHALPVIVIVENNGWSLATQIHERRSVIDIAKFAESLGAGYEKLNGNDVYNYIERMKLIRECALKNSSPVVIEVMLDTLGGWYVEKDDKTGERYINYHAGPTPKIEVGGSPVIENKSSDPVFVLQEHFNKELLEKMSEEILKTIKEEINEA